MKIPFADRQLLILVSCFSSISWQVLFWVLLLVTRSFIWCLCYCCLSYASLIEDGSLVAWHFLLPSLSVELTLFWPFKYSLQSPSMTQDTYDKKTRHSSSDFLWKTNLIMDQEQDTPSSQSEPQVLFFSFCVAHHPIFQMFFLCWSDFYIKFKN